MFVDRSSPMEFKALLAPIAVITSFLLILTTSSASFQNTTFNFSSFNPNQQGIQFAGNSSFDTNSIQLTTNRNEQGSKDSVGWATYKDPMRLWDRSTGKISDFNTQFSFVIDSQGKSTFADGLTFFLVPNGSQMPEKSHGGSLVLPNTSSSSSDTSNFPFVAVEFDTFANEWDPGFIPGTLTTKPHVGIDINSVDSNVTEMWEWNKIPIGGQAQARITYNSTAGNLNVLLIDQSDANVPETQNKNITSLSCRVNLSDILPEWVTLGFSGATGYLFAYHKIISWEFNSSLQVADPVEPNPSPSSPPPNPSPLRPPTKNKTWVWVVISCAGAIVLFITIVVIAWFRRSPKEGSRCADVEEDGNAALIDEELERMAGPRKFSYNELAMATGDFTVGRLLGEGGFGKVYEGCLSGLDNKVAIKKITTDSKQGLMECAAELKAVSQLRHRSLVQLFGWCHRDKELLLVYELMSNGSLDSHLFKHKTLLTWEIRYRITQDLASAILYLHEEWAKCVVHRDIKCSNIMLDSSFNAKLGDFGLARLVDHGKGSQTTMLAGTMGYLAPECISTGRASKESDVYSFGVVALEIACGRRVIESRAEEGQFQLVYWVWELYGTGKLLDAVDPVLEGRYDTGEMGLLMMVGLWCAHPDHALRPSILEALNVLKFKGSLPALPLKMPVPTYASPPNMLPLSLSLVSSGSTNNKDGTSYTTKSSTCTSSSNASTSSPSALLLNTH